MFIRIRPDGIHSLSVARSHPDTVTVLLPEQFTGANLEVTQTDARVLLGMLATALGVVTVDVKARPGRAEELARNLAAALNLVVVDPNAPRVCRNCGRDIEITDGATWTSVGSGSDYCLADRDHEHAPRDLEV